MRVSEGHREQLDNDEGYYGYQVQDAPKEAVDIVINATLETNDGRSQWVWIRLPDGDLVLAVYPQGDTYFATEHLRSI
jgi:hypothetical protein